MCHTRRIGLFGGQGIAADNQIEVPLQLMRAQHGVGVTPLFVGNHRQTHTVGTQAIKNLHHVGVGLAAGSAASLVVAIKNAGNARQIRVCVDRLNGASLRAGEGLNQERTCAVPDPVSHLLGANGGQAALGQGVVDRIGTLRSGVNQRAVQVTHHQAQGLQGSSHAQPPRARLRRSIMRHTKGVKISCIAMSILPPGTTMVLARLIQESWIMLRRY